jgi:hypothetical protein
MQIFSKTFAALALAMAFTAAHATCVKSDGSIEGDAYVGAVDMLPLCEGTKTPENTPAPDKQAQENAANSVSAKQQPLEGASKDAHNMASTL